MNRSLVASLALSLLTALPRDGRAQDGEPSWIFSVVNAADVTIVTYTPQWFGAEEMAVTAEQLFGKHIKLQVLNQEGELTGHHDVPHFILLGHNILIRDSSANAKKIVAALAELEDAEMARLAEADAKRQEADRRDERRQEEARERGEEVPQYEPLVDDELRPRYVALKTLATALQPLRRSIERELPNNGGDAQSENVTAVPEANLLLLSDTRKRIDEMKALAARIDRPHPQVTISAAVLKVTESAEKNDKSVPAELVASLRALVPAPGYELLSMGALRCAIQAERVCEISTRNEDGSSWKLSFVPIAFDPQLGEISLQSCKFHLQAAPKSQDANRGGPATQEFETNLSIRLGEHVVLGAVGSAPVLVALRIENVKSVAAAGK